MVKNDGTKIRFLREFIRYFAHYFEYFLKIVEFYLFIRTLSSPDVQAILNSHENGLKIELFVIKDDAEGGAFYYLGELEQIKDSENEEFNLQEESLISMLFRLKTPVENTLFKYITGR